MSQIASESDQRVKSAANLAQRAKSDLQQDVNKKQQRKKKLQKDIQNMKYGITPSGPTGYGGGI